MRFVRKFIRRSISLVRRAFYRAISDARVEGRPCMASPLLAQGAGIVRLGADVRLGLACDTDFYASYIFLNPRSPESRIEIGRGSWVGNHFAAISEGPGIFIGEDVLVGTRVEIYDTDFHAVDSLTRLSSVPKRGAVKIGNSVWIGNNVTILKGTEIGEHSVVAAGAVVSGKFPANAVLGGVPAKVIRQIDFPAEA